jgi:hypothetical protein
MSQIGYYRYKISDSFEGTQTVNFFKNGALAHTATIEARKFCTNYKLLKYLDSSGRYRFFPFNDKWLQVDKPTQIGSSNNFITSILNSQAAQKNIGYRNERRLTLVAESVSQAELDKLTDIFISPRIYLMIGDTDILQNWILVTVSGDGVGRPKKNNFKKVLLEITLPEYYAVTKI